MELTHEEIESLLGAYALDAVSPEEVAAIEEHLTTCPRCRAEVSAHREVVALLAGGGAEAPLGVWDRIAGELHGESGTPTELAPLRVLHQIRDGEAPRRASWRRRLPVLLTAAAVVALLALLSVQVSHLGDEVQQYQKAADAGGLAPAVASVLSGPHQTITLTAAHGSARGTVAIAHSGEGYWVRTSLSRLPSDHTYQLWAQVNGRAISIGLLGADPHVYSAFRVPTGAKLLMVTDEPAGGTTAPTSDPIVQGSVTTA